MQLLFLSLCNAVLRGIVRFHFEITFSTPTQSSYVQKVGKSTFERFRSDSKR